MLKVSPCSAVWLSGGQTVSTYADHLHSCRPLRRCRRSPEVLAVIIRWLNYGELARPLHVSFHSTLLESSRYLKCKPASISIKLGACLSSVFESFQRISTIFSITSHLMIWYRNCRTGFIWNLIGKKNELLQMIIKAREGKKLWMWPIANSICTSPLAVLSLCRFIYTDRRRLLSFVHRWHF